MNPLKLDLIGLILVFIRQQLKKFSERNILTENPKCPPQLTDFLRKTLFDLNGIHPFKMAIDFDFRTILFIRFKDRLQ